MDGLAYNAQDDHKVDPAIKNLQQIILLLKIHSNFSRAEEATLRGCKQTNSVLQSAGLDYNNLRHSQNIVNSSVKMYYYFSDILQSLNELYPKPKNNRQAEDANQQIAQKNVPFDLQN